MHVQRSTGYTHLPTVFVSDRDDNHSMWTAPPPLPPPPELALPDTHGDIMIKFPHLQEFGCSVQVVYSGGEIQPN